jgi:DNA-binding transcriptional regulator LsrR (DeoR family)
VSTPRQQNRKAVEFAIKQKAMTVVQIAKATGVSQPCVKAVLAVLRDEGLVHIPTWPRVGESFRHVAAYRYGAGTDVEKPPLQTREERAAKNRAYRAASANRKAQAAEAERRERIARELARPAFRDPFIAALFGPYEARA